MRLMDKVFGPEFAHNIFYYVDDIILISETFEEHMTLLRKGLCKVETSRTHYYLIWKSLFSVASLLNF
jgi:hypothetical protein